MPAPPPDAVSGRAKEGGPGEVPDPYYGGEDGFGAVLDLVERASQRWLERLRSEL